MILEGVDPRDTQWDLDWPVYRVSFRHQPPAPAGVAQQHAMWHCDKYRLSDVTDVEEVIEWARVKARVKTRVKARTNQAFVIYVEKRDAERSGLVRLFGVEPNSAT